MVGAGGAGGVGGTADAGGADDGGEGGMGTDIVVGVEALGVTLTPAPAD
jgi:hypothetical protein